MKRLFKLILFSVSCALVNLNASDLLIRTYPDGARDDQTAYLLTNNIVPISFYVFSAKTSGLLLDEPKLLLSMPKDIELINYSIFNNDKHLKSNDEIYPPPSFEQQANINHYIINCEKSRSPLNVFKATKWTIYSPYHVYVFIKIPQDMTDKSFDIKWQFNDDKKLTNGVVKVKALAVREHTVKPEKFMIWSGLGYTNGLLSKTVLSSYLDTMRHYGITHLLNEGLPHKGSNRSLSEETIHMILNKGLGLVDREAMNKVFRPGVLGLKKEGVELPIKDFYTDLLGKLGKLPICPSSTIANGGSFCFKQACEQIKEDYQKGYRWFFFDLEQKIYFMCYCKECRTAFADFIKKDKAFVVNAVALDLIYKYPLDWYKFRSLQTGKTMDLMRRMVKKTCPEAQIGINNALSIPWANIKGLGQGGTAFAEDPGIIDFGVDFHNTDALKGGLSDVIINKLYSDKKNRYYGEITKPVIARSGFFCDINWNYFCILGRAELSKQQNGVFGCDKRPELLKLAVANNAANGAIGVEISAPDITDALCYNSLSKAIEYIGKFEDLIDLSHKQPEEKILVWDLTSDNSPYDEIGKSNYYDRLYFYGPAKKYGFIQYTFHKKADEYLISMFNWDLYQDKDTKVSLDVAHNDKYFVTAFIDGSDFAITNANKTQWSSLELKEGISLKIPAGSVCALKISTKASKIKLTKKSDLSFKVGKESKAIDLEAWRTNQKPSLTPLKIMIYNLELKRLKKELNIPDKSFYKFSSVRINSWLVPVDKNKKLNNPEAEIVDTVDHAKEGNKSIRIRYHHSLNEKSREDTVMSLTGVFLGETVKVTLWICGDESDTRLALTLRDANGETFHYSSDDNGVSRLSWKGWKKLEYTLARTESRRSFGGPLDSKDRFDFPVSSLGLCLLKVGNNKSESTIWVSGIKAIDKDFKDWPLLF